MLLTNFSACAMVKLLLLALPFSCVAAVSGMVSAAEESRAKYTALVKSAQPQNGVPIGAPSAPGSLPSYPMSAPMSDESSNMEKQALASSRRQKMKLLSKQMSISAMKLNLAAAERIRHIAARMYRQIKFKTLTPFYKKVARKVQEVNSLKMSSKSVKKQRRMSLGSPDVISCYALISCARDFLANNDRRLLDEYLEFIEPGTPEANRELLGCWSETVPSAGFQRFFFKIGDEAVENLVVEALERAGNVEVTGTRSAGQSETLAQQYLDKLEHRGNDHGGASVEPWM